MQLISAIQRYMGKKLEYFIRVICIPKEVKYTMCALCKKLFLLFILLSILIHSCSICLADTAEGALLAQLSNAYRMLFLEDGRILLASSTDGTNAIRCIGRDGSLLWEHNTAAIDHRSAFTALVQTQDGSFAFLGREEGAPYQVVFINADGTPRDVLTLPSDIYTPTLCSDGIYYVTDASVEEPPCISRMGWDGRTDTQGFDGIRSINILHGQSGQYTNLLVLQRYHNDERRLCIVCLDALGKIKWIYDIGDFADYANTVWTDNDLGGITIAAAHLLNPGQDGTTRLRVICLDDRGTVVWEKEVINHSPSPRLMEQTEEGDYRMLGTIRDASMRNQSFLLTLGYDGSFMQNVFKPVWADFVSYIDDEIYTVIYNEESEVEAFLPFAQIGDVYWNSFSIR